jgi:hypothetical protein
MPILQVTRKEKVFPEADSFKCPRTLLSRIRKNLREKQNSIAAGGQAAKTTSLKGPIIFLSGTMTTEHLTIVSAAIECHILFVA